MPGLFDDSYLPPWLVPKDSPTDYLLKGVQVGNQIADNLIRSKSLELQSAQTAAHVGETMADIALKKETLNQLNADNAAWLQSDSKTLPAWLSTPLGKLETVPTPEVNSRKGFDVVQKRQQLEEQYRVRTEATEARKEQAALRLEAEKQRIENSAQALKDRQAWQNEFYSLKEEDRNAIILNGGVGKDDFLTPEGRAMVGNILRSEGRRIGQKPSDTKPLSPLGKLHSDRAAAVARGDTEAVKTFDNAIQAQVQKDDLYSNAPEVIEVDMPDGTKAPFLKWGKQPLRDLSKLSSVKKVEIDLAKDRVNRLEAAVLRDSSPELVRAANLARYQLDKMLKGVPQAKKTLEWNPDNAKGAKSNTLPYNAPDREPTTEELTTPLSQSPTNSAPKTVRVKSPDGRTGTIPADQLEEAKKAGYTLLE